MRSVRGRPAAADGGGGGDGAQTGAFGQPTAGDPRPVLPGVASAQKAALLYRRGVSPAEDEGGRRDPAPGDDGGLLLPPIRTRPARHDEGRHGNVGVAFVVRGSDPCGAFCGDGAWRGGEVGRRVGVGSVGRRSCGAIWVGGGEGGGGLLYDAGFVLVREAGVEGDDVFLGGCVGFVDGDVFDEACSIGRCGRLRFSVRDDDGSGGFWVFGGGFGVVVG